MYTKIHHTHTLCSGHRAIVYEAQVLLCVYTSIYIYMYIYIHIDIYICICMYAHVCVLKSMYEVATISRLLKIIGLFCRV